MRLKLITLHVGFWSVLCVAPLAAFAQGAAKPGPQCSAARLVGTWERVSLLRNALSVQPPDAPLFVKFGSDGYWSMMEMPDDRPKVDKPLEQLTTKELFARFDKVEGGQGTWTVKADGSVVTRRHVVNIAPGGENSNQDRLCWFEDEILALVGTGSNRSPQARFRRLPDQKNPVHPLVGTWDRTTLVADCRAVPQAALILILGEDGWFSQTELPTGRKSPGKPIEQYAVADYVNSFGRLSAARGTYTVNGNTLTRKQVASVDPNQVGREIAGEFSVSGDAMTLRGTARTGMKFESVFRKLKPQETTAK
ncbi:MAG: hypothetical protein ACRD2N_18360 [Vicinamibacterales bacterium]